MNFFRKNSTAYLPHCLVPLLLLAALNYWNGIRTADSALEVEAQAHLNLLSGEIDRRLQEQRVELSRATLSDEVQNLLSLKKNEASIALPVKSTGAPASPNDVLVTLSSVLRGRAHFFRVAVFDKSRLRLGQINRQKSVQGTDTFSFGEREEAITPVSNDPGKKAFATILNGSILRYSVPVLGDSSKEELGSIVADLNLEEVIEEASSVLTSRDTRNSQNAFVTVIDPSARIIYHANRDLQGNAVSSAMPEFLPISEALSRGSSGVQRFRGSSSGNFITAFSPLPQWNLGIAVGYDRSQLISSAHRWGIFGVLLALIGGFAGALLISRQVQRKSPGLERVEQGLNAIAKGELDRRIELKSSDDARVIADNINAMTERLRSQIAREEETRQFQSFVRVSAMLTHDLKNAIEALSLIVGNMERHFDNEQFRLDALKSLTSATEKLKGIVARLARPLSSLSGEHPKPKSIDLVPILKRVTAMTAEPMRERHALELKLPTNLFVYIDPERIEKVIENLIINALESMSQKNGKLRIEAGLTPRGAATFSVSDTGPGMSQTFIENRLFRPFSTTKKHGVGLGLYTCREVIEASAGTIEVESVEGAGTTFRVVLPSASHDSRN